MVEATAGKGASSNLDAYYIKPNNLVDLFEGSAVRYANHKLFGTKNKTTNQYEWVNYSDVAERVNNLRGALHKLGLSKGEKVGVIVSNCTEWFVCANATHGLGGIFVPMYEKELQKVWQYIISDATIKYLFVSNQKVYDVVMSFKKDIPTLKDVFIIFGEGEKSLAALEKMGKENPAPSYKPHWSETAFIIYTSGTTGDPKGVLLHHGNMTHNARECHVTFDEGDPEEVGLCILPWAHSFGLTADLHTYITGGWALAFAESADKLLVNFSEVKPTHMSAVPRVFNIIYDKIQQGVAADPAKKKVFDAAVAEAVKNRDLKEKTEEFKFYDAVAFSTIRKSPCSSPMSACPPTTATDFRKPRRSFPTIRPNGATSTERSASLSRIPMWSSTNHAWGKTARTAKSWCTARRSCRAITTNRPSPGKP